MGVGLGDDYFSRHILFHIHIAKSAGTSILDALTEILGPADVLNRNESAAPKTAVSSLSPTRRRSLKLLSGHFWYGTQERYFDRRPVYLAAVRDPIERFMSLFHFVLAAGAHPFHHEFAARGPDGSARWFFLEKTRLANEPCPPPGRSTAAALATRVALIEAPRSAPRWI